MKSQKILILAAIPQGLRLDKEIREIEEAIRRSANRDSFEIKIITAVRTKDIRRALAEESPQIVHFCGHGEQDGSLRLEDDGGNNQLVSPEGLASLFKLHADYVNCVLLNACYSSKSAQAISKHINYVIGINLPIEDNAAIVFSQGFYDGLGYDNVNNLDVIPRAFEEGIVAIKLENLSLGSIPLICKSGIAQSEIEAISRNDGRSSNRNSEVDDLSSTHNVDYTQLRNFLKAGKWKEADRETYLVMLKVVGREKNDWIRDRELSQFPCTALSTIDRLWIKYSNERFGFSVQKNIYLEVGGILDDKFYKEAWEQFGDRVGWRVEGSWVSYDQVTFDTIAPLGNLPMTRALDGEEMSFVSYFKRFSCLASRLKDCNI